MFLFDTYWISGIAVLGLTGAIANVALLFVLTKVYMKSRLSSLLFRSQAIIDAYTCFIIFIYKVVPVEINTGFPGLDMFLCYFWYRENLFWLGSILSVHTMVGISVDRLLAVLYPAGYKQKQMLFITLFLLYLFIMVLFLFVPSCLLHRYQRNVCFLALFINSSATRIMFRVEGYVWILLAYAYPATMVIISHILIIRRLKRVAVNSNSQELEISLEISAHEGDANVLHEDSAHRVTSLGLLIRRLVFTTILMAGSFMILHLYESIVSVLSHSYVFSYASGSGRQQIGVMLITLGCWLNPYILVGTNKYLSDYVSQHILRRIDNHVNKRRVVKSPENEVTNIELSQN